MILLGVRKVKEGGDNRVVFDFLKEFEVVLSVEVNCMV